MAFGKVAVVFGTNRATGIFFDIGARQNPISAHGGQAFTDIAKYIWIAPGPAGVIDPERLVHLEATVEKFGAAQFDLTERDTDIGMKDTFNEHFARVGERVGAVWFERIFGRNHIG